ncbi:DUF3618 domain-containing protein [uncultured Tessaracoccus sp.]|uniref:DUF3618 domain-containing protein n=1 Tax=uncultured Tessaracoccus sp. TaxID=905023 RepID=UPI0026098EFB|nr:DUF3618 domain-containing protein [uncultured Tessaracoccus sp.]
MAKERTVEDIRAELAGTRANLKSSIAGFRESVEPKNVAKQSVAEVKQFAQNEFNEAKKQFVHEDGSIRTQRILAIAGAVVGVVAFAVTLNALSKRGQLNAAKTKKAITAK